MPEERDLNGKKEEHPQDVPLSPAPKEKEKEGVGQWVQRQFFKHALPWMPGGMMAFPDMVEGEGNGERPLSPNDELLALTGQNMSELSDEKKKEMLKKINMDITTACQGVLSLDAGKGLLLLIEKGHLKEDSSLKDINAKMGRFPKPNIFRSGDQAKGALARLSKILDALKPSYPLNPDLIPEDVKMKRKNINKADLDDLVGRWRNVCDQANKKNYQGATLTYNAMIKKMQSLRPPLAMPSFVSSPKQTSDDLRVVFRQAATWLNDEIFRPHGHQIGSHCSGIVEDWKSTALYRNLDIWGLSRTATVRTDAKQETLGFSSNGWGFVDRAHIRWAANKSFTDRQKGRGLNSTDPVALALRKKGLLTDTELTRYDKYCTVLQEMTQKGLYSPQETHELLNRAAHFEEGEHAVVQTVRRALSTEEEKEKSPLARRSFIGTIERTLVARHEVFREFPGETRFRMAEDASEEGRAKLCAMAESMRRFMQMNPPQYDLATIAFLEFLAMCEKVQMNLTIYEKSLMDVIADEPEAYSQELDYIMRKIHYEVGLPSIQQTMESLAVQRGIILPTKPPAKREDFDKATTDQYFGIVEEVVNRVCIAPEQVLGNMDFYTRHPAARARGEGLQREAVFRMRNMVEAESQKQESERDYSEAIVRVRDDLQKTTNEKGEAVFTPEEIEYLIQNRTFGDRIQRVAAEERTALEGLVQEDVKTAVERLRVKNPNVIYQLGNVEVLGKIAVELGVKVSDGMTVGTIQEQILSKLKK